MARKKAQQRRGQVIERGDRRWLVRVYLGRGSDGKRRYSAKTVIGTYAQAEQRLTKMLRDIDTREFIEPSKRTLAQYSVEWLETTKRRPHSALADRTPSEFAEVARHFTPAGVS